MAANTETINTLLSGVEEASKVPTKRRYIPIKPTVENLTSLMYQKGVLPDELDRLIELVTSRNHLDQASLGSLVRNLYPSTKVPSVAVLKVVGSLGHGEVKPSLALQALLLRWLALVYHTLEDPGTLSRAYAVLFNLLDTAAVRPQLCQLLALTTRRKHVRPHRIQALLMAVRQSGSDPSLVGLLRVFKNYYPEIIVGEATRGRASAFKHPDPEWRERLERIQRIEAAGARDGLDTSRNGFSTKHDVGRLIRGGRGEGLPAVHTLHAQEESITLEEIHTADAFVQNLEKIELPNQLVAVLADPLLQKLLLLRPDGEAQTRVSHWLAACLQDIEAGDADQSLLLDMAEIIHDYVICTKALPPLFLTCFRKFFVVWNGVDRRDAVLDTLSYVPLMDFAALYGSICQSLERVILDNTPESQLALLRFYTNLLCRWRITLLLHTSDTSMLPTGAVSALVGHVNKLALTLTQTAPTTQCYLAILDFYESATSIMSDPKLLNSVEITIPHPLLVYTLYFSQSLAVVSRLCGVLATCKKAFEKAIAPSAARPMTAVEKRSTDVFNSFLMDICNCLVRSQAFSKSDHNAQGCLVPEALVQALKIYVARVDSDFSLDSVLSLSYSPVLSLQSISFFRQEEDGDLEDPAAQIEMRHAGPVTPRSLVQLAKRGGLQMSWQEYRSGILEYLEEKGVRGIPDLMYATMKTMKKRA